MQPADDGGACENVPVIGRVGRVWRAASDWTHRFAGHPDPLVETGNWVALAIGTHVPFWPLYLWAAAGRQVFPAALLTMALTPVFLVVPLIARRSGLAGRVSMLLAGVANTVFTMWVMGQNTGTDLFFAPCAGLAAIMFRRSERWLMMALTLFPLATWYALQFQPLPALHPVGPRAAHQILVLNAFSIGVLFALFGWIQTNVHWRLEKGGSRRSDRH